MAKDELIEATSRAEAAAHGVYYDTASEFEQNCYDISAKAAFNIIAPAVLDLALAEVRMREGPTNKHESPVKWQRRLTCEAIRALKERFI